MKKLFLISLLISLLIGVWIGESGWHRISISYAAGKLYDRFRIDLAIPLNAQGNPVQWFRDPFLLSDFNITEGVTNRYQAFKRISRRFSNRCEKINAGTPKEERSTDVKRHICNHEVGLPCLLEEDLTDN